MGTRGLRAYLYKNRYYRSRIPCSAYPDGFGDWFAAQIPREQEARQGDLDSIFNEHDIKDDDELEDAELNWGEGYELLISYLGRALLFEDIRSNTQGVVPGGDYDVEWSYVIDLDNRAFTINGLMHFHLDNMPPGSLNSYFWRVPSPDYPDEACIPTCAHPPSTPIEYIATVSRWLPPEFDVARAHEEYAQLAPVILSANGWGAPTWSCLTVAQRLSANLVQTILFDSAEKLSNPDAVKMRDSFDICCWQLLSATAPSHLCCPVDPPPSNTTRNNRTLSIEDLEQDSPRRNCVTPHYHELPGWLSGPKTHIGRNYYWFRGCLVGFRPRLDDVEYVKYETVQMVNNLRKYGRTTGIGVVFSGRHILAVAIDGDTVRCSHPLLFHDLKMKCQEGFLLATHLLSPMLTVNKTPWTQTSTPKSIAPVSIGLPKELIRQVMFLLDHDSYRNLEGVSRLLREMYAAYPRVGSHVLLRHIDDYKYFVHDTATGTESIAYLQRSEPFQSYYDTLVHSFQRVSFGPHNLYPSSRYRGGVIRGAESKLKVLLNDEVEWDGGWPTIRLQAVHGAWQFVDPAVATSNFPKEMEYDAERHRCPGGGTWDNYHW